jgi:transcriptional regulator with XRE-family HTH domain
VLGAASCIGSVKQIILSVKENEHGASTRGTLHGLAVRVSDPLTGRWAALRLAGAREPEDTTMADDELQDVVEKVGRRLREARVERRLTLAQVAASAGVTRAFVSQVELGQTSASVSNMYRIASALGLDLSTLFEPPLFEPLRSRLVRVDEGKASFYGGRDVAYYRLTPEDERRVELIETRATPGGSPDEELYRREGEVAVAHVKQGSLEIRFESETVLMNKGDTLTYDPTVPHTWRNPSAHGDLVVLFVHLPGGMF